MVVDLVLKNGVCLLPHPENLGQVLEERVDIAIKDGLIYKIGSSIGLKPKQMLSQKHLHILPGLIDTQVHFREPGSEHKEDMAYGSLSAIKGGITAVFEMPNTKPPTTSLPALNDKIQRAEGRSWCDFAFYAGAKKDNMAFLESLSLGKMSGLCGIKVFMGRSTGGLLVDDEEFLEQIFQRVKVIVAIHSEDEERLKARQHIAEGADVNQHPVWRDELTALISTKKAVRLAEKHRQRIHILHISTAEEMEFLKNHREYVSTEVTPQHLTLSAPECYGEHGTLVQMNPPIRDKRHHQALWLALQKGLVDVIGSDHAPHTLEEKQKPYPRSPSGFPGTQTLLPIMLNHIHKGRLDLKKLVCLLAHNPAKIFKLKNQGFIKEGLKAHFTVVDMKKEKTIEEAWLANKNPWSPFAGKTVTGWPVATFLYGRAVVKEDEVIGSPAGQPIKFSSL